MSRKHYVAIAEAMRSIPDRSIRQAVASNLVALFRQDNPRFNMQRFLEAFELA